MSARSELAIATDGTGKPLVLLHGVGADGRIWREVVRRMRSERRLLVPDLPGLGASPPVGRGFDLAAVADALAAALREAAGQPFDLVGNSLGGAVAVVLARRHAELVDHLVLVAPGGFSPRPGLLGQPIARAAPALLAGRRLLGTPLMGSGLARRVMLWGTVAAPRELSARDAREMLRASRSSSRIRPAVAAVLAADLMQELAQVESPLGLVWGDRDGVIPISTLQTIRRACPAARVRVIAKAGHVPQLERPDQFVDALRFLLGTAETP